MCVKRKYCDETSISKTIDNPSKTSEGPVRIGPVWLTMTCTRVSARAFSTGDISRYLATFEKRKNPREIKLYILNKASYITEKFIKK